MIASIKSVKIGLIAVSILLLMALYTWFSLSSIPIKKQTSSIEHYEQFSVELPKLAPGNLFVIGRNRQDEETLTEIQSNSNTADASDDIEAISLVGIFGIGEETSSVFMIGNEKKTLLINDWITPSIQVTAIKGNEVHVSVKGETKIFSLFPTYHNSQ
ncbi:hypothetical protein [Vibrio metschnikovii]|uniref:hypothetical protein n=1 Tax=Vibrio metschnikovii TaxID=28172 RepID=UPI001C2FEA3A|nr:hypothetical protein [Vibrio metschnikovii]EKO3566102.1 hypothetical protein [Vibrio metschnikovii]EKO3770710.1 hypothetical protein [Vibrio metschnikovii]